MQTEELIKLIYHIQDVGCELQDVEIKAANKGCPTKLYDSLSAFSNQEQGGIILFGMDEKQNFMAVGVYDAQDLQHRVAEQCKQMQPEVRALFTVCEFAGKILVSAEIPSVDIAERPVFYKGVGRQKGSFIRVGEADEPMSDYEIYSYDAYRRRVRDDIREAEFANMSQMDRGLIGKYLQELKENKPNLSQLDESEIVELMGIAMGGKPTLSGVMCFSKYPQAAFPQLAITAVVVPGLRMGQMGVDDERFISNKRIEGTIAEMLEEAVLFVKRNMRVKTIIDQDGKRNDKGEYPIKAVREAILNALMHRDYSIHTEGAPIRIEMYSDRIEVINVGGIYGRLTVDGLGKVHGDTRNQILANILEVQKVAENRYSGIPTIKSEMEAFGLPTPVFRNDRGNFVVVLANNIDCVVSESMANPNQSQRRVMVQTEGGNLIRETSLLSYRKDFSVEDDKPWGDGAGEGTLGPERERDATNLTEFCHIPRSREEIAKFVGKTQYYTVKTIIEPLVESGTLRMTIPQKPKSKNQRYWGE